MSQDPITANFEISAGSAIALFHYPNRQWLRAESPIMSQGDRVHGHSYTPHSTNQINSRVALLHIRFYLFQGLISSLGHDLEKDYCDDEIHNA